MFRKILMFLFVTLVSLYAQGSFGTDAKYEYRSLIDMPTAGILQKGFVGVTLDVLPQGGVVSKIEVGAFENFSFGISFGGTNVIGTGSVQWYQLPGVNVRARILDETEGLPALTLGFDSQGKGEYFKDLHRYEIKSPGFYVAAAKNFDFFGYLSVHGVLNYSLERKDGDKDLDFWVGVEKTVGKKFSLIAEYDFATNDNTANAIGNGNGYLNFGVRWSVGEGFTVGLNLRNMLDNRKVNSGKADRGIFVEYVKSIF